MQFLELERGRVHYRIDGAADAPPLLLIHSLGATMAMWDAQVAALEPYFRVVRYDIRGHGRSAVPPGPYTMEALGLDAVGLLDALGIARARVCGLSLGGVIGQWLGVHAGKRINDLVLSNTAALIGTHLVWNSRINIIREGGMTAITNSMIERWFTPRFFASGHKNVEQTRQMMLHTPAPGYVACAEALRDTDLRGEVSQVKARTLIIVSSHDPATPAIDGRWLSETIPGARCVELQASHMSNLEVPAQFNRVLLEFLLPETQKR